MSVTMKIGVPVDPLPVRNPNWMEGYMEEYGKGYVDRDELGRQDLPEDVMIIEECMRETQLSNCNFLQTYDCDERKCQWNFIFWFLVVILPIVLIFLIVGAWKRRRVF
jgi:hypothetical protein